jgi:hypothetical protein
VRRTTCSRSPAPRGCSNRLSLAVLLASGQYAEPEPSSIDEVALAEPLIVEHNGLRSTAGTLAPPRHSMPLSTTPVLSWTDYPSWDKGTLSCVWRTETHAFAGAVRGGARDRFLDEGPGRTRLPIRRALDVDRRVDATSCRQDAMPRDQIEIDPSRKSLFARITFTQTGRPLWARALAWSSTSSTLAGSSSSKPMPP